MSSPFLASAYRQSFRDVFHAFRDQGRGFEEDSVHILSGDHQPHNVPCLVTTLSLVSVGSVQVAARRWSCPAFTPARILNRTSASDADDCASLQALLYSVQALAKQSLASVQCRIANDPVGSVRF